MTSKVIQRNIHISHRKASLVIDLIRNKPIDEAIRILQHTQKKFAPIVLKLLNSAVANVTNNKKDMDPTNLYIYKIVANQGPTAKRRNFRAKGSADIIFKRTTHLEIVLSDDKDELAKELAAIKAKKAKSSTPIETKPVEQPKKEAKKETKPKKVVEPVVEENEPVDPELLKREQEVLVVVDEKDDNGEEVKTETIIISASPKVVKELFDNPEKDVLFYKNTPVNKVSRVIVYATAPVQKVVGEFDLELIDKGAVSTNWKKYSKRSVLSKKDYDVYYTGKDQAHAMVSSKAYKYRKPKALSDYNMSKGPSGFQYLK